MKIPISDTLSAMRNPCPHPRELRHYESSPGQKEFLFEDTVAPAAHRELRDLLLTVAADKGSVAHGAARAIEKLEIQHLTRGTARWEDWDAMRGELQSYCAPGRCVMLLLDTTHRPEQLLERLGELGALKKRIGAVVLAERLGWEELHPDLSQALKEFERVDTVVKTLVRTRRAVWRSAVLDLTELVPGYIAGPRFFVP